MNNKRINPEIESRKPLEFPTTMENPPSPENRRSQKPKKPFYKRWWFGLLVVMAIGTIGAGIEDSRNPSGDTLPPSTEIPQEESIESQEPPESLTSGIHEEKQPTTPEVPKEYEAALKRARSYGRIFHMSRNGIYEQLTSDVEGFTPEAAQYAIDNLDMDYRENAYQKAQNYFEKMNMSKEGIYNQLTSSAEGFTMEEAQYAVDKLFQS